MEIACLKSCFKLTAEEIYQSPLNGPAFITYKLDRVQVGTSYCHLNVIHARHQSYYYTELNKV